MSRADKVFRLAELGPVNEDLLHQVANGEWYDYPDDYQHWDVVEASVVSGKW